MNFEWKASLVRPCSILDSPRHSSPDSGCCFSVTLWLCDSVDTFWVNLSYDGPATYLLRMSYPFNRTGLTSRDNFNKWTKSRLAIGNGKRPRKRELLSNRWVSIGSKDFVYFEMPDNSFRYANCTGDPLKRKPETGIFGQDWRLVNIWSVAFVQKEKRTPLRNLVGNV